MTAVRNKRTLITGAGHGLGKALARRFAQAGAEVIVSDRDPDCVAATVRELSEAGWRVFGYPFDVTAADQVEAVRCRLNEERGRIDVLINNAGVVYGGGFSNVPLAQHRATIAVNLVGVVTVTHVFLPDLMARPQGHIVNIASAAALLALPWATTYAASKWAVLGFSDSLREELRQQGQHQVRVTAICPNYITTGLFAGAQPARLTWLLRPDDVALSVLRAVERDREFLLLPWTARLLYAVSGLLPRWAHRQLCSLLGVSSSMAGWQGHASAGDRGGAEEYGP